MSLKAEWKKIETRWKAWWGKFKAAHLVAPDPNDGALASIHDEFYKWGYRATKWPEVSKASCWEGKNASVRHMNTLSPAFSDEQAADRFQWAVDRGCNTVHLFVANQGDGEGSGYSIYGGAPTLGKVDSEAVARMARRISAARGKGLAVCLWLMADDSSKWNKTLLSDPARYAADLKSSGLLDVADAVCLGLEMDEYMSSSQAQTLAAAVRGVYFGPVGTHHTSGKGTFAGLGDIVFWQIEPGKSAAEVASATQKAKKSTGKPVVMFELARNPARGLCEAALAAGAAGVGNW